MNTIQLPDGQSAILFTENPSKQLGIVDVATIKRLAAMLPSTSLSTIRREFKDKLDNCQSIQQYVDVIAEEFNFHTTVNLLAQYNPELAEVQFVRE